MLALLPNHKAKYLRTFSFVRYMVRQELSFSQAPNRILEDLVLRAWCSTAHRTVDYVHSFIDAELHYLSNPNLQEQTFMMTTPRRIRDRNGPETFEIDYIASHYFHPKTRRTVFKVKYSGFKGTFPQPAEDLVKCPFVVDRMERRTGLKGNQVCNHY